MTPALRAALYAAMTDQAILPLLTLSHADMAEPIRIVQSQADVVSRGNTFQAVAFAITLPKDDGETHPTVRLVVDNVDRRFTELIRTVPTPADTMLELVLASAPNTVEAGPWYFSAQTVSWDVSQVEFTLGHEDLLNAEHLVYGLDPVTFPAMFR